MKIRKKTVAFVLWIHRKKTVAFACGSTEKKLTFQIFSGSVDQKTELGERNDNDKKNCYFFLLDLQRKPVTFARGSTEKNLLLPYIQSVNPQKVN